MPVRPVEFLEDVLLHFCGVLKAYARTLALQLPARASYVKHISLS